MVTDSPHSTRFRVYIREWMNKRELSDEDLGEIMGVARQTVYRWRTEEHRLSPPKIAAIAEALGLEPIDLLRPPDRRSIDAITKDASDADHAAIFDFADRWVKRSGSD